MSLSRRVKRLEHRATPTAGPIRAMSDTELVERSDTLARKLVEGFKAGDRAPRTLRLLGGILRPVEDPGRWPVQHERSKALTALLSPAELQQLQYSTPTEVGP